MATIKTRKQLVDFYFNILCFVILGIYSVHCEITIFTNFSANANNKEDVKSNSNEKSVTVFLVHDWDTTTDLSPALKIKDEILKFRKNVSDVVICDWSTFSRTPDYHNVAARYTSKVAGEIYSKIKRTGLKLENVELVGHGLGAHIVGQVGKLFKKEGTIVGKIFGLNPTGPYFKDHPNESLQKEDATFVQVFHTDKRYGIYKNIGDLDLYPDPSEIDDCNSVPLLKRNLCFHKGAQSVFLKSIQNTEKNNNTKNAMYSMSILTLDVSPSMQMYGRAVNMITAAKRLINSLPIGYSIGIVMFGGTAKELLAPMNITSKEDRAFISSKLPTALTQIANTSIGAGILKARGVIAPIVASNSNSYCPDIILVTDGEENQAPYLRGIDHDTADFMNCGRVHSIALGNEASVGLEALSTGTKGQTYFATDTNSLDKLTQSLIAASTAQFSLRKQTSDIETVEQPIVLPSKEVEIDRQNGSASVSFQIDPEIGGNAEIFISTPNPGELNAELIAPDGQIYGATNYTTEEDLHGILFKLLEIQPGNWSIKLNTPQIITTNPKRSRRAVTDATRSSKATVFVSAFPSKKGQEPIRLEAILSKNILEKGEEPIAIEAVLSRGYDGIIGATVHAQIISDGKVDEIELYDNGVGPDRLKTDGIYTTYIVLKELQPGRRYEVQVVASSHPNSTTMVRKQSEDPFELGDSELSLLGYHFERQATPGSFRVAPTYKYAKLPPNPVKDLKVVKIDMEEKLVTIEWTASDGDLIQLRGFTSNAETSGLIFMPSHVVEGSLNPWLPGEKQNVQIKVPDELWSSATGNNGVNDTTASKNTIDLYFTVRTGSNSSGQLQLSEISNIAPAEFSIPFDIIELKESTISTTLIILIIALVLLLLVIVGLAGWIYTRRRKAFFRIRSAKYVNKDMDKL